MKNIAVTGTRHFTEKLSDLLCGSLLVGVYPYVNIEAMGLEKYGQYLRDIEEYDWIMFTSTNGIKIFFEGLDKLNISKARLGGTRFAVVGNSTKKALLDYGFKASFCPSSFCGEVLGREFSEYVLGEGLDRDKLKVLIPRALKGDKKLTNILSQAKIKYVDMPLYDTVVEEAVLEKLILELEEFDAVTFASTMGVNLLCEALKKKDGMKSLRTKKIFCIGNETARALEGFGFFEYKVAKAATAQGLAKLVIDDI